MMKKIFIDKGSHCCSGDSKRIRLRYKYATRPTIYILKDEGRGRGPFLVIGSHHPLLCLQPSSTSTTPCCFYPLLIVFPRVITCFWTVQGNFNLFWCFWHIFIMFLVVSPLFGCFFGFLGSVWTCFHMFWCVFWLSKVIITCFDAVDMFLTCPLVFFPPFLGAFLGFWTCMWHLSLLPLLMYIFYSLFYLFAPSSLGSPWVEQITVPCSGWTWFWAHLKLKVKPSEVLPPWLPLFQQKGCLPVVLWPFFWSGPLSGLQYTGRFLRSIFNCCCHHRFLICAVELGFSAGL